MFYRYAAVLSTLAALCETSEGVHVGYVAFLLVQSYNVPVLGFDTLLPQLGNNVSTFNQPGPYDPKL
jgi:hypothetical protein